MKSNKIRVAVFLGGPYSEHEVSVSSGNNIIGLIDNEKYEVIPVFVTREDKWSIGPNELKNITDIAFITFHGEYDKDEIVQEKLNDLGIPYTGSDVLHSALARNKILTNRLFQACGFNIPPFIAVHRYDKEVPSGDLNLPLIVKPADKGSSVGITIVRRLDDLSEAIQKAFGFSNDVIVQEFVHGKEISCGVVEDDSGDLIPLPVAEIIPKPNGYFDYRAKYIHGESEHFIPARLSKKGAEFIQETAIKAHRSIGASGLSRTDMIIGDDDTLYVLEINTMPDMTPTSLILLSAQAHGLNQADLLDRILTTVLRKSGMILSSLSY
jgi:D-alanine-D-alanine ligase